MASSFFTLSRNFSYSSSAAAAFCFCSRANCANTSSSAFFLASFSLCIFCFCSSVRCSALHFSCMSLKCTSNAALSVMCSSSCKILISTDKVRRMTEDIACSGSKASSRSRSREPACACSSSRAFAIIGAHRVYDVVSPIQVVCVLLLFLALHLQN